MSYIRNKYMSAAIICLLSAAPISAAKEPLRLPPSSRWHVNYADDSCRLARAFGTDKEKVLLAMDRFDSTDSFRMVLSGRGMKARSYAKTALIRFGPAEEEQEIGFYPGNWGKAEPAIILQTSLRIAPLSAEEKEGDQNWDSERIIPPLGKEREAAIMFLEVGKPLARPVILETGPLDAPFAALQKCTDELLTHWGVDVVKHGKLTKKVLPLESPGDWLRSSDYPTIMLSRGEGGIVNFRLSIDKEGAVSACHIQQSTRPAEFDRAVCTGLTRRARFSPALDEGGEPIASYWVSTVRFEIPQ